MKSFTSGLLAGTTLSPARVARSLGSPPEPLRFRRKRFSGTTIVHPDAIPALVASFTEPVSYAPSAGTTGVLFRKHLQCPEITDAQIAAIDEVGTQFITRHIDEKHLASTLCGYFRFGTIERYRPKDNELNTGRFGDFQEGTQRNAFGSRDDFFAHFDFGDGGGLSNIEFFGFEAPVLVEFQVNEYCSCSSTGEYRADRALSLREKGNPTLGAYVTYDLYKLRIALAEIIAENPDLTGHTLVGRRVVYGEKYRRWLVEGHFDLQKHRDPVAIWMGTAFIKSLAYEHEDEFRLLAIHPGRLGCLEEGTQALIFEDTRIASAITDHGTF